MITLIAAIGKNRELGFKNQLLWDIPEDMQHFKAYTMGKVVVMGSNTFFSIGRILPGRKNVIVSSMALPQNLIRAKSIDEALSIEDNFPEIVIIGGASIYAQTIDRADKLVLTLIDTEFTADVFFPQYDLADWTINSIVESNNETHNYKFVEYIRNESN